MSNVKLLASPPVIGLLPARCATSTSQPTKGLEQLPTHIQSSLNAAIRVLTSAAVDYLASSGDPYALHSASRAFVRKIESLVSPTFSTYRYTPPHEDLRSKADMDRELLDLIYSFSASPCEKTTTMEVTHD